MRARRDPSKSSTRISAVPPAAWWHGPASNGWLRGFVPEKSARCCVSIARKPRCRATSRARIGVADSRDCSGPAPRWTAEYRLPPCASAPQRAAGRCSLSSHFPAATPAASNSRLASRASTVLRSKAGHCRMPAWRSIHGAGITIPRHNTHLSADSGDCDQPFRLKVITDSGDRDHAMTRPITFDRNAHICLCR